MRFTMRFSARMETLELIVSAAQEGRTVESLLRRELAISRGLISSLKFRPQGILLNGTPVRVTAQTRTGDRLTVRIADRGCNAAAPLALDVPILWEDDALAVLNKPAGVGVYGEGTPNIAGFLSMKWGSSIKYHPVNRLDVGTTGLMVVAKDGYTHDRLRRLLHTDDFRREYLAVADGRMPSERGVIELPISRDPDAAGKRWIDSSGLPSRTDYEVLSRSADRTFLRLRLHTGRTHQIRLHLAAIGYALTGDPLYGTPSPRIARPALHSAHLHLRHPITGEFLHLSAPLPPDMTALCNAENLHE